jgi:prepilin-type N-terminal cleavage/methylation domain-containing protein
MQGTSRREGFTALEVLIAVSLMAVVLMGGLALFRTGSRGLTTTAAHAVIREEALRLLERFGQDLDRLVVGDDFDKGRFPSVVDPVRLVGHGDGQELTFYAYHHRRFHLEDRRLVLVGQRVRYWIREREEGPGVDLYRNDEKLNRIPLHSAEFRFLDAADAGQLGISPRHAIELILRPLTPGKPDDDRLAKHNAQSRLFRMRNVESQYACLLTLKEAGAPYPILAKVPSPPRRARVYQKYRLDQVPLDWMRPLGLIAIDRGTDYDDATANVHEEVY